MIPLVHASLITASLVAAPPAVPHHSSLAVPAAVPAAGLRAAIADSSRRLEARPARAAQSAPARKKNWIQRHPACFGAAVGFVAGFFIGYLPGDDAVFDDFEAGFNGAVLGGIGAGAGAIVGALAGRDD
jgi:hypothetical protein